MVSSVLTLLLTLPLGATPIEGGLLSTTIEPLDTSAGDQFDPHVDGDVMAYSSDQGTAATREIRFYRYDTATGGAIDNTLPGGQYTTDLLSGVNQGRIAFTRIFPVGRSAIFLFDATTPTVPPVEIAPDPTSNRSSVAVGGDSVLFGDYGVEAAGEMMHVDLPSGVVTRLTNDGYYDTNPAVSPDGAVLAWEKCPTSLFSCEVWVATRQGGAWVTSLVGQMPSSNANTDGTLVVYQATRAGSLTGQDIFMRSVTGGVEEALELPGYQVNPSIRGRVIAFESRADGEANRDIFLYDRDTNVLYQVTDTEDFNETLNDVTVLSDGRVRLVWSVNDDPDFLNRNIYTTTFTLPDDGGTGGGGGSGGGAGTGGGAGEGGGAGAGGGSGTGGGGACQSRTVTLTAERRYNPSRWDDANANFSTPFAFALPASLPVTSGNAGNQWAELTLHAPDGCQVTCRYKGGASREHPVNAGDVAAGLSYGFYGCSGKGSSLHAGSLVEVKRLRLRVEKGDSHRGKTTASVALGEVCGGTPTAFCAHRPPHHGHHHHHHRGCYHGGGHSLWKGAHRLVGPGLKRIDVEAVTPESFGTVQQGLDAGDEPQAAGCSSTGGALVWPLALCLVAFTALSRPTPKPIRLRIRAWRHRLRR